jgi:hypothetical protein
MPRSSTAQAPPYRRKPHATTTTRHNAPIGMREVMPISA